MYSNASCSYVLPKLFSTKNISIYSSSNFSISIFVVLIMYFYQFGFNMEIMKKLLLVSGNVHRDTS